MKNKDANKNKNSAYWAYAIIVIALTSGLFIHQFKKPSVSDIVDSSLQESVLTIQDVADIQKQSTQQAIDEAVNKALLGESVDNDTVNNSSLGEQIKDSINDTTITPTYDSTVEILEVISSNKIKLTYKGQTKTIRLIGVGPNGRKENLELLLENTKNKLQIELDTKKADGEYMLVYLWDGEPSDVNNMINIQMIKNEYSTCTYNAGSTIIEQPNIKYFGDFIDATK